MLRQLQLLMATHMNSGQRKKLTFRLRRFRVHISVEVSSNQILQTAGGGAVINANKITSTAAFNAWLKSETEFAISPLIPQIDGFCNLQLSLMMTKRYIETGK